MLCLLLLLIGVCCLLPSLLPNVVRCRVLFVVCYVLFAVVCCYCLLLLLLRNVSCCWLCCCC